MALFAKNDPAGSLGLFEASVKEYAVAGSVFGEGWAHFEVGRRSSGWSDPMRRTRALKKRLGSCTTRVTSRRGTVRDHDPVRSVGPGGERTPARLAGAAWALRDGAVSTSSASPKTPPRASTGRPSRPSPERMPPPTEKDSRSALPRRLPSPEVDDPR